MAKYLSYVSDGIDWPSYGLLPDQWRAIYKPEPESGELRLIQAIVEDALECAQGQQFTSTGKPLKHKYTKLVDEAKRWIASDDYQPFTFLWCCDHLNLEAPYVRQQVVSTRITLARRANAGSPLTHIPAPLPSFTSRLTVATTPEACKRCLALFFKWY